MSRHDHSVLYRRMPRRGLASWTGAVATAVLSGSVAMAGNILLNPSFEGSAGAWPPVPPVEWTYYGPGENYYIEPTGATEGPAQDGGRYYKILGTIWDTGAANWTGVYQDKMCAEGWTYAASGWFRTRTGDTMGLDNRAWVEVSFRDSGGNTLALYKTAEFGALFGVDTWNFLDVTNACDIGNNNVVTGAVTQLVAPAGTAAVRYQFVHYQVNNGGGACQFDTALLDQLIGPVPPVLSSVAPGNMLLANAANGISFTVSSPSSTPIDDSGIHLTVNGTNVSSSLAITGDPTSKNVLYDGLLSNKTYSASITVTDSFGLTISANFSFDTMAPILVWEGEDYDFDGGSFIDNPQLDNAAGNPNSYFGKTGTEEVDFHETTGEGDKFYRANDRMATTYANDAQRPKFAGTAFTDYKLGWFNTGEWVNYTRTFPAGSYTIYGRLAGGQGASTSTLSKVTPTGTTDLGIFSIAGLGWNTYEYAALKDSLGNVLTVTLGGVETLRYTTGGGVDPNFLMLVPAETGTPLVLGMYPNGTQPFQYTNKFSVTLTSPGSSIPAGGVKLMLNGTDVSGDLVISGTDTQNVTFPYLQPNATHSVVLTVTNVSGVGISRSFSFDTFSQTNYMVEAEQFDYDGGLYIDNPTPNDYYLIGGTPEIDYHHTFVNGEQEAFRLGMPTEQTTDFLRQKFVDYFANDYNLGWFGNGDWANYTRTYPSGTYVVYGRLAGDGGYSVYLDQVTSGGGTTNQVTKRLGRWGAQGRGWQTFDWVLLRDLNLTAPVRIQLNGVTTLRIATTGNCNPNYFMLIPASGINVSATRSGSDVVISFPTQSGLYYRVMSSSSLNGPWTLLDTLPGDGNVKSATDAATGSGKFYRVEAP